MTEVSLGGRASSSRGPSSLELLTTGGGGGGGSEVDEWRYGQDEEGEGEEEVVEGAETRIRIDDVW